MQDDSFPTRQSLLFRLRDWDDQEAWKRFYDTYRRLIYSTAIQAGLNPSDAEDVVQETVASVCQRMKEFKYDPAASSFKTWLHTLTRRRIADQFRKQGRRVVTVELRPGEDTLTEPIQKIADPASLEPDARWEADWEKNVLAAAIERVKGLVSPTQFQIYDYHVLQGNTVAQTANALGVSGAQVYLAKLRVGKVHKQQVAQLREVFL